MGIDQDASIKVLDCRQEAHARGLGNGHRILYGVAGSGKTVILVARAKLLAQGDSSKQHLLLCYNVALSLYLQRLLAGTTNVVVRHFDWWCRDQGIRRNQGEENEELGGRLLSVLQQGKGDARKYGAIFVDEAQDFAASWFKCVLEAMADPLDGDLIIVGDGNQGLYRNREFTWSDVGIQAVGRTINSKFDLDRCYRSTREIITLAQPFASAGQSQAEVAIAAMPIDPKQCTRTSSLRPILFRCANPDEECRYAAAIAFELMAGKWFGRDLPAPLDPSDIGILYRKAPGDQAKGLLSLLEKQIGKAVWLSRDRDALQRICDPLVKIQTIHSAKGLQFKAVIILWSGQMPSTGESDSLAVERRLMYVGLTRAEDYLTVLYSTTSPYVTELLASGAGEAVIAGAG